VDETADVGAAADSIVWGRFLNAGQTCVAPDYVLVHVSRAADFLAAAKRSLESRYGPAGPLRAEAPDYCRVVDDAHYRRLADALARTVAGGAVLEVGGESDPDSRYFAPTIVSNVTFEAPLMDEEIFGPVLPVLTYTDLDDALGRTRALGKPLTLYIFSARRATVEHILENTTAGGTVVNATMTHYGNPHLPFGGVGSSGQGSYHGFYGFRTFSHERAVLHQRWPRLAHFLYPPYRGALHALTRRVLRMLE